MKEKRGKKEKKQDEWEKKPNVDEESRKRLEALALFAKRLMEDGPEEDPDIEGDDICEPLMLWAHKTDGVMIFIGAVIDRKLSKEIYDMYACTLGMIDEILVTLDDDLIGMV